MRKNRIRKRVFLVLGIAAIFLFISGALTQYGIEKQKLPQFNKVELSKTIKNLGQENNDVLSAESKKRELYINTETLNIKVVDKETGCEWNSICLDENSNDLDKSPLVIKFMGKDNSLYEWDSYKYAVKNKRYEVNQVKDGFQIVFDFLEVGTYRLNEYIPKKISIERYEELFVKKLDDKIKENTVTPKQASRYKNALKMAYKKDEENGCYFIATNINTIPLSMVKTLVEFAKTVEYTTDMLIEDSSQFDLTVDIMEPASFAVAMEVTLDGDDLKVRIPTYEIETGNDFYTIQNISILPSFGYIPAEEISEGYIFVPDGSGALFKLNDYNSKYPEYTRPVYNNTYYNTLYNLSEYPENIHMPVFGMYYTKNAENGGISQGFMGIIEEGAELAHINVQLGTPDTSKGGVPYNKVGSSFDCMQYSRVSIFGPYSDNPAKYLSSTGLIDADYTIRYKLFAERTDYYDMAVAYREHLIEKNGLFLSYELSPKFFFDVIGTLTLEERFLGIPYEKQVSMTAYDELLKILEDMSYMDKVIAYKGFFNPDITNTKPRANGSENEFNKLIEYINDNDELYFNIDLMRIAKKGDGFRARKHAVKGYDSKPVEFMPYNYAVGRFGYTQKMKSHLLNPLYLSGVTNDFLKSYQQYNNIFINDMGSTYYAHYKQDENVSPIISANILKSCLDEISKQKTIALDNPNMDKIKYAEYAVNISRESSDYATMYCSVPFRHLVMNGLTQYTTLNTNMAADTGSYFIMQAFEAGSIPKFTIAYKNIDILKNTDYSDYLSIQYSLLSDKIKAMYDEYVNGIKKIGTREITGHEMLQKNVFKTTYGSGTTVIVNYNKFPVALEKGKYKLDGVDYIIIPGHGLE